MSFPSHLGLYRIVRDYFLYLGWGAMQLYQEMYNNDMQQKSDVLHT